METNFFDHLEKNHPRVKIGDYQHLVDVSAVPQPRPSDLCPICGTLHQQRVIPQSLSTPAREESESREIPTSRRKARVGFVSSEVSDNEDNGQPAENSSVRRPARRSTRATDDYGVENCIAEHLKGLAFNFSQRLYDEDERESDLPSGRSTDSELEELPDVGSDDDPPWLPSGQCDEINYFPIPDMEKEEMKKCIAENLKLLREKLDWDVDRQAKEPNLSYEEREELFPDKHRRSNESIWSGMYPKTALAFAACVSVIVELCGKALLASEAKERDNKLDIQECLHYTTVYSTVLEWLPGLGPKSETQKSVYVLVRNPPSDCILADERICSSI